MGPNNIIEKILYELKKYIPERLFRALQPYYHFLLVFLSAFIYRFPSRSLTVIGVTGTKGKSTTTELVNAILEEAGYKTAVSNTIRFKMGKNEIRNTYKMSIPGRFFIQRFMRRAIDEGCTHLVLELTSQGVLQHRHRFIELDSLIFTNLAPEHIESHGSFENYRNAKLEIAKSLSRSSKKRRLLVVNEDDENASHFLAIKNVEIHRYSLKVAEPWVASEKGITFTLGGTGISSQLLGTFNLSNILASTTLAEGIGIPLKKIKKAIEKFSGIRGRLEAVNEGQDFGVIVDYAHTPDSLQKVYETFENKRKICVIGNTGGGRDKWKRKDMARIAELHCSHIILTNEDPYDEDPMEIIEDMAKAIHIPKYEIELDRRKAIRKAIEKAESGDIILITGKGTDPYIMEAKGKRTPWDDATVAREELRSYLKK